MVSTNSHQTPEASEDFRKNIIVNDEWVKEQERVLGVNLSGPIRRAIAVAMSQGEPLDALARVKKEYFEGAENVTDARLIDRISENLRKQMRVAGASKAVNIREAKGFSESEAFLKKISDSLHSTLFSSSKKPDKEKLNAVFRIKNIFNQLDYEINVTGLLSFDPKALQKVVDWYVKKYGFDPKVFSGSVEKYINLLAPDII